MLTPKAQHQVAAPSTLAHHLSDRSLSCWEALRSSHALWPWFALCRGCRAISHFQDRPATALGPALLLPDTSTSVDASRPPSGPALVKRADCYLPGEPED